MERRKHKLAIIGLLIANTILGFLTYCSWAEIIYELIDVLYLFISIWIFVIMLTVGFAAAYPREKTKKYEEIGTAAEFVPVEDEEIEVPVEIVPEGEIVEKPIETKIDNILSEASNIDDLSGQPHHLSEEVFVEKIAEKLAEKLVTQFEIILEPDIDTEPDDMDDIEDHIKELKSIDEKVDRITSNSSEVKSQRQMVRKYLEDNPMATKEELIDKLKISEQTALLYFKQWKNKKWV